MVPIQHWKVFEKAVLGRQLCPGEHVVPLQVTGGAAGVGVDPPGAELCVLAAGIGGSMRFVNWGLTTVRMKYAPANNNNPRSAASIHSFASPCPDGFPADVIYFTPPYTTTPNASTPAIANENW